LANYWQVWKWSRVCVKITIRCVHYRGGFGNRTSTSESSASGSCCQVFWEKNRVVSGYTISIVQQHNAIYQHFSSLLGIKVLVGFKLLSAFSCSALLLMTLHSQARALSGHHTTASELAVGLWRPINHFTGQHITRLLTFLNRLHYNCFIMWKTQLR